MLFFELFLFFISLQKIYLITDYCSSRIEPKEPNDCVFLSTKENKCCFNPKNQSKCFNTSGEGFICEADYFFDYLIGEENFSKYKNKIGFCTFNNGEIKGAFKYEGVIKNVLDIKEINGLKIKCLSNQKITKINLLFLFLILVNLL